MADATNTTPTPISRRAVEAQIDALIDLLNVLDADPDLEPDLAGYSAGMDSREGDDSDLEPSLGFSNGGYRPEDQPQDGPGFHMNANAGDDCEDEHDGAEPHEDGEPSLGWTDNPNQASPHWSQTAPAFWGATDLEDGVGPVRKERPASRTGNCVLVGAGVF